MNGSSPLLEVQEVSLTFKNVAALSRVSCSVQKGSITSLIGPNGAGKTSMLNCISGRYTPTKGKINMSGRELSGVAAHKRTGFGLARTFQNIALFRGLSVLDNLMVGRHSRLDYGLLAAIFYLGKARAEEDRHRHRVEEIIDFLNLYPTATRSPDTCPTGCRRRSSWAAPWPPSPNCCSSTSPWRA